MRRVTADAYPLTANGLGRSASLPQNRAQGEIMGRTISYQNRLSGQFPPAPTRGMIVGTENQRAGHEIHVTEPIHYAS